MTWRRRASKASSRSVYLVFNTIFNLTTQDSPGRYVFHCHNLEHEERAMMYDALDAADLGYLRAKDDPIVFHDLRHSFGTLAIRKAPVTDVQHWMGHADIQTTMRYVHYVPQHDNAAKLTAAFTTAHSDSSAMTSAV